MNRVILFLIAGLIWASQCLAQTGTAPVSAKDTVLMPAALPKVKDVKANILADTTPFVTPKKTGLFSAIVPGLGQYHNKQYWKIPVIYALVGTSIYFLSDNIKNYNGFRKEYANRLSANYVPDPNSDYSQYSPTAVKEGMDYYRRNLDLTALLTAVGYTLQVIDAVVFAHLKDFDISQDIGLNVRPVLMPQGGIGFGLVMKF
jgi:hypothetical protein